MARYDVERRTQAKRRLKTAVMSQQIITTQIQKWKWSQPNNANNIKTKMWTGGPTRGEAESESKWVWEEMEKRKRKNTPVRAVLV